MSKCGTIEFLYINKENINLNSVSLHKRTKHYWNEGYFARKRCKKIVINVNNSNTNRRANWTLGNTRSLRLSFNNSVKRRAVGYAFSLVVRG